MKKRKESFWGIHSDFHAEPDFGVIGRELREEDIREICQLLKPDYWQVDSKGHPGWASYPTRYENALPEYACDTLALWRKVTKEEDVAMFVHYSGVRDENYCVKHPEDAVMNPDGSRSVWATRTNGPYVDKLLIPQLSEMIERYGIDGVWVDGDCWAVEMDYHPDTVAAFERETGCDLKGKLPIKPEDAYYQEYREYMRTLFRRYLDHYVTELHRKYPDFQIASNWMYSDFAPEKVEAGVDYLSGDFVSWNCVNWARYAGRALAQQKMSWDLMAWGHREGTSDLTKADFLHVHSTQLLQDAAITISLGGGFQVVISQYPDGAPSMPELRRLAPLPEFMRKREPYCFHGRIMHQAAMVFSLHDRSRENPVDDRMNKAVFNRGNTAPKIGLVALLCDAGQSLEIVSEHTLRDHYQEYPMLIVPELEVGLAADTVAELLDYAKNGGNLVLVGARTCKLFEEAGAPYHAGKPAKEPVEKETARCVCTHERDNQRFFTLDGKDFGGAMYPLQIDPDEGTEAETVASLCFNSRAARYPMAVIINYGKGKLAVIGANLGSDYYHEEQYLQRTLIRTIAEKLYTPKARIESACGLVELTCLEKDGRLMLQLTNVNGNHSNDRCGTEDMIPPALDIQVSIACSSSPQKLILQPDGKELSFEYRDGRAYTAVDRIDIHNVIEVVE